jgi:hypothetical protein
MLGSPALRAALAGVAITLATGVSLAGCTAVTDGPPSRPPAPQPVTTITHGNTDNAPSFRPPPFRVLYGSTELALAPFTYCSSNNGVGGCADGFDDDPPSVGSPAQLVVFVPVSELTELSVSQTMVTSGCVVDAQAQHMGGGWWVVEPTGPAATYRVSLFASGNGAGDMVADVLWTTQQGAGPDLPLTCTGK